MLTNCFGPHASTRTYCSVIDGPVLEFKCWNFLVVLLGRVAIFTSKYSYSLYC